MDGVWQNKKEKVKEVFIKFYKNLFAGAEQKYAVLEAIVKKGNRIIEVHIKNSSV